jgi:hypothetical protein
VASDIRAQRRPVTAWSGIRRQSVARLFTSLYLSQRVPAQHLHSSFRSSEVIAPRPSLLVFVGLEICQFFVIFFLL